MIDIKLIRENRVFLFRYLLIFWTKGVKMLLQIRNEETI